MTVGPGAQDPDVGPLISARQLDRVLGYIDAGRDQGARIVIGGGRADGFERGYFVTPTILDRVASDARVAQEEIFGPVLSIHPVAQESEALAVANNVAYGLAAGIFTQDIDRALRLATQVQAGQIYINEYFAGGEETHSVATSRVGLDGKKARGVTQLHPGKEHRDPSPWGPIAQAMVVRKVARAVISRGRQPLVARIPGQGLATDRSPLQ